MRTDRPTRGSRRGRRARWRPLALAIGLALGIAPPSLRAQEPLSLAAPDLTRSIQTALARYSPELAAQRAEVEAARARAEAVGFAPPMVLSGELEEVPDAFDVGDGTYRLEVSREFLSGGRSAAARALAAAETRSAEVELTAAERRVAARGLQELSRLIAASLTARRLAGEDSLLVAAEAPLRDRFSVGDARYVDVLRLRTARLRVQSDRARSIAESLMAREALIGLAGAEGASVVAALVDSAVASAPAVDPDVALPPPPPLDSLLALSGELRLAEAALDRARASGRLVAAERGTRFAASVGAQRFAAEDGGSSFGPVLGASITLPFTARRANGAAVLAAEREVVAAEASLAAVGSRVRAGLSGALVRYEAARQRLAAYDATLLLGAREEREIALAAYRTGEMSLIELLDFERALARAEIEQVRARAEAAEAYANLISAAAGGR